MKVICCNDGMEAIIVSGSQKEIEKELETRAKKHYEQVKWSFGNLESYKDYRRRVYWHIHDVKAIRLGGK